MSKIYITSDLHFCHDKPFLYEPRGFSSIEEHDNVIIENWNKLVSKDDEVYILGDLVLDDIDKGIELLKKLNGILFLIRGNHDTKDKLSKIFGSSVGIFSITCDNVIKYNKYNFYLSHYPTMTDKWSNKKHFNQYLYNLCGHTHTKDRWLDWDKGCIYHCELDAHNNTPVLIDDIIDDLRKRWEEFQNA